jgi:hypothetical protein
MRHEEKIKSIQEALKPLMDNGEVLTFRKEYGDVSIEYYDKDRQQKVYKTLAIIKRYNHKTKVVTSFFGVIMYIAFLIFIVILEGNVIDRYLGINLDFLKHWLFYIIVLSILIYNVKLFSTFVLKTYISIIWKNIKEEFELNNIDSNFLQNELKNTEDYKNLISIFIDKLAKSEKTKLANLYKDYR